MTIHALSPSRAECAALDAADPLAAFREEFTMPEKEIYLDGNSLGALPRRTAERVRRMVEQEWGQGLVRGYAEHGWWDLPTRLGDRLGGLLGAAAGQMVACDSTSINIFKVLTAALRMRPGRRAIVADATSFPTDLYIGASVAATLRDDGALRLIDDLAGLAGVLEELGDRTAVVLLNLVDYRSGSLQDMAELTDLAHRHGALMIWDLCHAAGALPVELDACGVDFAVGCTYKYLNAGPGAPAYLYCAERHLESAEQPLTGWWGHAAPFALETAYTPDAGIRRFLTGSQPMLGCAALDASLEVWERADMAAVRAKSLALTGLFIELADGLSGYGIEVATPREPDRRGSQVALRHPDGFPIVRALLERGVIGDFRAPHFLRFGFAPLYLRHVDVWDAAAELADILETGAWRDPRFAHRGTTT